MSDNEMSPGRGREASPSAPSSRRSSTVGSGVNTSQAQPVEVPSQRTPQQAQHRSESSSYGTVSSRLPVTSPEIAPIKPGKKPAIGRRTTSHGPRKGMEFSVDDADDEVDEDLAGPKPHEKQARMASGSLRRQRSTLRRRPTAQAPALPRVSSEEGDEDDATEQERAGAPTDMSLPPSAIEATEEEAVADEVDDDEDDEDDDTSDAESFTLKDKQQAINQTHPFGIRIWKPALYKKSRSVQRTAEGDIHSTPGGFVSRWLVFFNFLWTVLFGWWLCLVAAAGGFICLAFAFCPGCLEYGRVFFSLARYLFYPFGRYVKLMQEEAYAEEDEGEGRSISEYEQWQSGDIEEGRLFFGPHNGSLVGRRRNSIDSAGETQSLLGRHGRGNSHENGTQKSKRRLFGRGEWNVGRVIFFVFFYGLVTPALTIVSGICWLLVFSIPMGRVTFLLFDHMRRHPLALSFHADSSNTRRPGAPSSSILLCTYRAVGLKYWKYTIDGTNIILFNLLGVVAFTIFDYFVLGQALGVDNFITNFGFVFTLALISVIPLAYFIGQAVASISAQSSMGVGATINAFFSTVVEVYLYCVALKEGKAALVEGSIIGSIFAGILFLPGLSMCFGALKRKTQRFNVKSAGVTSTMLLFAVIALFGPTLFYLIYGSHQLICRSCSHPPNEPNERDCRRCYFAQAPALNDQFYLNAVRPYTWFAAILLFLSYIIGLLFTLRTHAAVIWATEPDDKRVEKMEASAAHMMGSSIVNVPHEVAHGSVSATGTIHRDNIRDTQIYKRILGQSLKQAGLNTAREPSSGMNSAREPSSAVDKRHASPTTADGPTPHLVPPHGSDDPDRPTSAVSPASPRFRGFMDGTNEQIVRQVAEIAATAAAVAARDTTARAQRKTSTRSVTGTGPTPERPHAARTSTAGDEADLAAATAAGAATAEQGGGGHDAPNWSKQKSSIILLTATVAYAIIAEILVRTVDAVLDSVTVDEKFLGITLFALVPNTTEFLNAISFAMNGNIALSMEIGSAYALQVCLLQAPALVLFSAVHGNYLLPDKLSNHVFTLIFPQWDMVTVILCVFLLSYTVGEGKSNYFKGSVLILSYLVVIVGFYFSSFGDIDTMGIDPNDTLAMSQSFRTRGRTSSGFAF